MRIAYLVNQYPKISHTFIRREIQSLEHLGCEVVRISIRNMTETVIDAEDRHESHSTLVLLKPLPCLASLVRVAALRPLGMLATVSHIWRLWRAAGHGAVQHIAYLAEACRLFSLLRRAGVSHVHAHFGTNAAAVALLCRDLGGPPFSFTVHGPEEFDHPEQISLGEKIKYAAFVVGISSFGRSQLQRWCRPEDWHKLHIIRCSPELAWLQADPHPIPETQRLVCVGRLCSEKGHLVLLEAAAMLASQGMHFELVLIGDGPLRGAITARCEELGLTKHVRLAGWQSGEQTRLWLQSSRALVLASFAEGLPVVIMEAFAEGRPVVSSYIAGIPELVENGVNGWLVPAGAVAALASALQQTLELPIAQLQEMGCQGRLSVIKQHHPIQQAKALLALLSGTPAQAVESFEPANGVSQPAVLEPVSAVELAA